MNPEYEDFDLDLARMFDEARHPLAADTFLSAMLARVQRARRAQLLWRVGTLLTVVLLSGLIAPYAAQGSLAVAAWIGERLPVLGGALVSPVGWACSLLVAWRIMRRALSFGR
jgi:hypothetical protein